MITVNNCAVSNFLLALSSTAHSTATAEKTSGESLLSSGISIRNVNRSPIRTVSTSRLRASKILILGGGASGDELM